MTALGWGPGPSLMFGVIFFMICIFTQQAIAAPVYENDGTGLEAFHEELTNGCYYNFQHYDEGDRILTNEPCLNCTCHNRMLMCYLRVCPFTKAIGENCKIEKREDQCCPIITCPEVPVHLLTSTTTASPATDSTEVGQLDNYGCTLNELFYSDGARVPSDANKPCELCYCIRNKTTCIMQECTLHVQGCKPIYQDGVCCPVRYDCDREEEDLLETTVSSGLLLTTTMSPGASTECKYNNSIFNDGELIKTENACEHCYCMRGEIVCAVQECGQPMEKTGTNCVAVPKEGQCCPEYECDNATFTTTINPIDELTTVIREEASTETIVPLQNEIVSAGHRDDDKLNKADDSGITESETGSPYERTTEAVILDEKDTQTASVEEGEKPTQAQDNIAQTTESTDKEVDHKEIPSDLVTNSEDTITPSEPLGEIEQKPTESTDIPEMMHSEDAPKHNLAEGENQILEKGEDQLPITETHQETETLQPEINVSDEHTSSQETEAPKPEIVTESAIVPESSSSTEGTEVETEEKGPVSNEKSTHIPEGDAGTTEGKLESDNLEPSTSALPVEIDGLDHKPTEIVSDAETTSTPEKELQETDLVTGTPEIEPIVSDEKEQTKDVTSESAADSTQEPLTSLPEIIENQTVPLSVSDNVESTDKTEPLEAHTEGLLYSEEKTTSKPEVELDETADKVNVPSEEPIDAQKEDDHIPTIVPDQNIETESPPSEVLGDKAEQEEDKGQENLPENELLPTTENIPLSLDEQKPTEENIEKTEKPAEADEYLEASEKPTDSDENIEKTEKPAEADESLEATEKPTDSDENVEKTEKPAEGDESLEATEKPTDSDENVEKTEKPAEADESLETSEKPTDSDIQLPEISEHQTESTDYLVTSENPVENSEDQSETSKPAEIESQTTEKQIQSDDKVAPTEAPVQSEEQEIQVTENPADNIEPLELTEKSEISEDEVPLKSTEKPIDSTERESETTSKTIEVVENEPVTTEKSVQSNEGELEYTDRIFLERVTTAKSVEIAPHETEATEQPIESDTTEKAFDSEATKTPEVRPETSEEPVESDEHKLETTETPVESDVQHITSDSPETEITEKSEIEPETSDKPTETSVLLEASEAPVEIMEPVTSETPIEGIENEQVNTEKSTDVEKVETPQIETEKPAESIDQEYHHTSEKPAETTEYDLVTSEKPSGSEEHEKPSESDDQEKLSESGEEPKTSEKPSESTTLQPEISDKPETPEPEPPTTVASHEISETPINEPSQSSEEPFVEFEDNVTQNAIQPVGETSEVLEQKPEIVEVPTETPVELSTSIAYKPEEQPVISDEKDTESPLVIEEVTKSSTGSEILPTESQNEGEVTSQPEDESLKTDAPKISDEITENVLLQSEHSIPGEGDCLVDGITYTNNSSVQPANPCQLTCKCVSSIVQCVMIKCSPPPSNMVNCMPIFHGDDSCCPTYNCEGTKSKAPSSDSQIMEHVPEDEQKPTDAIEVTSEQAIIEDSAAPADSKEPEQPILPEEPKEPVLPDEHVQTVIPEEATQSLLPEEPVQEEISSQSTIEDNNVPSYIPVEAETSKPVEKLPDITEQSSEIIPSRGTTETESEIEGTTPKALDENISEPVVTSDDKLKPAEEVTEKVDLPTESVQAVEESSKDIAIGTTPKLESITEKSELPQSSEEPATDVSSEITSLLESVTEKSELPKEESESTTSKFESVPLEGSGESDEESHSEYPDVILPFASSTSQPIFHTEENELETSTSETVPLDKEEIDSNEIPSDDLSKPESTSGITTEQADIVQSTSSELNENEIVGDSKTEETPSEKPEEIYTVKPEDEQPDVEKTSSIPEISTEGAKMQETETEHFIIELGDISTQTLEHIGGIDETTTAPEILQVPLDSTEIPSVGDHVTDRNDVPVVDEESPVTLHSVSEEIPEKDQTLPTEDGQEPIILDNEITTVKAIEDHITDSPRLEQTDSHSENEISVDDILPVQTVTEKLPEVDDIQPSSVSTSSSDENEDLSGTTPSVLAEDTRAETLVPVIPVEIETEYHEPVVTDLPSKPDELDVTTKESGKVDEPIELTPSSNTEISEQTTVKPDQETEKPGDLISETEVPQTDEISEVPNVPIEIVTSESETEAPKSDTGSPILETQTIEPLLNELGTVPDSDQIPDLSTVAPKEESQGTDKSIEVSPALESSTTEVNIPQTAVDESKLQPEEPTPEVFTSVPLEKETKPNESDLENESSTAHDGYISNTEVSPVEPILPQEPSIIEDEIKITITEVPEMVTSEVKDIQKPEEGEALSMDVQTTESPVVPVDTQESIEPTSGEVIGNRIQTEDQTEDQTEGLGSEQTTKESIIAPIEIETSSPKASDEQTEPTSNPEEVDSEQKPLEEKPEDKEPESTPNYLEPTTIKTSIEETSDEKQESSSEQDQPIAVTTNEPSEAISISETEKSTEGEGQEIVTEKHSSPPEQSTSDLDVVPTETIPEGKLPVVDQETVTETEISSEYVTATPSDIQKPESSSEENILPVDKTEEPIVLVTEAVEYDSSSPIYQETVSDESSTSKSPEIVNLTSESGQSVEQTSEIVGGVHEEGIITDSTTETSIQQEPIKPSEEAIVDENVPIAVDSTTEKLPESSSGLPEIQSSEPTIADNITEKLADSSTGIPEINQPSEETVVADNLTEGIHELSSTGPSQESTETTIKPESSSAKDESGVELTTAEILPQEPVEFNKPTSLPIEPVATERPENETVTIQEQHLLENEVTSKPIESVEDDKRTSEGPSISSQEPDYVQVPIEQSSDYTPSQESSSTSGPVFESSTQDSYSTQSSLNVSAPPRIPGEDIESQKPIKPDYPTHPDDFGQMPQQYPYAPETDDYDEDDSAAFGPGTCRYGGKVYVSAQQIPRDDPCDFCFCFRSDIICLQQSCPPPIPGCHEEPIQGFCCPRYECPVSMATVLNVTTTTTTTTTTLPPHFLHHAYKGAAGRRGCQIQGKAYQVGEVVKSKSGPCLHCTCGGDGQMKCDPKVCSPQPMIQQMIAAVATSRSGAR